MAESPAPEENLEIISTEKNPDGSTTLKIKEKTLSGYRIRTVKKTPKTVKVNQAVVDRQTVLFFIVYFLSYTCVFIISAFLITRIGSSQLIVSNSIHP